jgi:hypothetical protein
MKKRETNCNGFTFLELFILLALGGTIFGIIGLTDPKSKVSTEVTYNIDSKLDDGNGTTGEIRTISSTSNFNDNQIVNEDICINSDGTYRLDSSESLNCNFAIKLDN